jgi:hypothetical protein
MPLSSFGPGYYVEAYLDYEGEVVKYNLVRDLQQPEDYGLVIDATDSTSLELPKIRLIDNSGVERIYYVNIENDLIVESGGFNNLIYSVNLAEGDIIKYNMENDDKIKRMNKVELEEYDGIYDGSSKELSDIGASINSSTLIFSKDEEQWNKIQMESLNEFVKGEYSVNEEGDYVELLIIENGIITDYPDTVYSVPENISKTSNLEGAEVYRIYGFVEGKEVYIYGDPAYTETLNAIENYDGQLMKLDLVQDKIKSFDIPDPELEFSEITNIYGGKILKVEGTFYEYSDEVTVYTALETEEAYSITGRKEAADIETGDFVQLYDLHGGFDGIVDIIILIKK